MFCRVGGRRWLLRRAKLGGHVTGDLRHVDAQEVGQVTPALGLRGVLALAAADLSRCRVKQEVLPFRLMVAVGALVVTGLRAAPAPAAAIPAPQITVAPGGGTTYNTPVSVSVTVNVSGAQARDFDERRLATVVQEQIRDALRGKGR